MKIEKKKNIRLRLSYSLRRQIDMEFLEPVWDVIFDGKYDIIWWPVDDWLRNITMEEILDDDSET